jgi:hypothetical protein
MSPADPLNKDDFNRYVDRHDHQHGELDSRLSRDMVPMPVYLADQRANERRFNQLEGVIANKADASRVVVVEGRLGTVEARPTSTRNLLIALAGLALTLLGIVVSAYISTHHGG